MTVDGMRPTSAGSLSYKSADDLDLLAGLWEEARFARLPCDAPSELRDLVEDIDNPKRVYAIYKASRRHNFQLLVQRYIVQLREGCGADYCSTPSCFTCRKRIAGRAPIRRYNTTSARTLAIHLASQDNPEKALCPNLKPSKAPPASVNSLKFVPASKPRLRDERAAPTSPKAAGFHDRLGSPKTVNGDAAQPVSLRSRSTTVKAGENGKLRPGTPRHEPSARKPPTQPAFSVVEQPVSKDHRSFAANLFGTVAFKMVEWLTPAAIDDMSRKTRNFRRGLDLEDRGQDVTLENSDAKPQQEKDCVSDQKKTVPETSIQSSETNGTAMDSRSPAGSGQIEKAATDSKDQPQHKHEPAPAARATGSRRNSNAKVRTSTGSKPKRKLSINPSSDDTSIEDPYAGLLRSPRTTGGPAEKNSRVSKTGGSGLARPISQLSSAGFFDDVSLEKMPPPKSLDLKPSTGRGQVDGAKGSDTCSTKDSTAASAASSPRSCSAGSVGTVGQDSESEDESILPQALSKLSADVVDFVCDVIQEDGTGENHMLHPQSVTRFHSQQSDREQLTRRKRRLVRGSSADLRAEWRLFVEQTFFYVLSDPHLVLRSFTKTGQLYDSQSLWYCMLRMTRIAPSLVFHSLWVAAASLFAPPKSLQTLKSPMTRVFPKSEPSLSNLEAGRLVSICLHALIAAAPLVTDSQQLYDMSRIRSHGLSLAGSGAVARQPTELCLQYEDAFTDPFALRLARRLFAAITTRRYFDELREFTIGDDDSDQEDVLAPLFSQLDFLNMDAVYVLDFSFPDRAIHETRVPILLLDWARAVMLNDWDGSPVVPGDGPFGGALALIEAMYKKRHELLLGDSQFRSDYFAERLDTLQMPNSWLSHTPTRQRVHLLDFPYLFNPSTLVTYFRSINFSRMNHAYDESSSLQERIERAAVGSTLAQHHKEELIDRLRVAATKYLILSIRRDSVIEDAFDQLWRREERELLRPLKVHLGESNGEEGFDSGGVQQEFFRLAIAEALNPDYGAFTVDERTRMAWFMPGSMEAEWKFELIGLLVSLAVYNGLTLPVTFPKALYRKLLGEPVTELHHIADGWPDLASGLTMLLEWDEKDGLVEDVFARTYEFSVSALGQHITRQMKPPSHDDDDHHGSHKEQQKNEEWPQFPKTLSQASYFPAPADGNPSEDEAPLVTSANRNAYVSDYIRYLTDVSVRPQYEAFARGFHTCLHPKSLSLLTPNLLQSLVEGVQEIDISELRRCARYVGWDASHRTVRDFWSVVKKYDDRMKRKLLEFVTASDRVPVGGVKNLLFTVQRNGEEDDPAGRLPTSYTCYGTLLLPEYKDREMLRERLGMALENAQGFGFA
ncbi:hypothetical protein VTK26DRAFT_5976 [Humicola hyalothermophila]